MRNRSLAANVLLLLLPVLVAAVTAVDRVHAQQLQVSQLTDDPDWGCVLGEVNEVTYKGRQGTTKVASVKQARRKLRNSKRKLKAKVASLKSTGRLSKKQKRRLARIRTRLRAKRALLAAVRACESGTIGKPAREQRTFDFYCQHAFNLRSVADRPNSCGIDLRSIRSGASSQRSSHNGVSLAAVIQILDDTLVAECSDKGGVFLRPTQLQLFFPLYHGVCSYPETGTVNTSIGSIPIVLGMEEEAADCLLASAPTAGAKDPCDGYDPDAPRGGGSTGGGTTKIPPSDEDCVVMRMEDEAADC